MINLDEFELKHLTPSQPDEEDHQPFTNPSFPEEEIHVNTQNHPIHQANIREILECYSSFQHSDNILDKVDQQQQQHSSFCNHFNNENSFEEKMRKRIERRIKNQTKNIPKNFGKGIISFIQSNQQKVKMLLSRHQVSYQQFVWKMKQEKKIINTIADLRRLWTDPKIGHCMRIISNLFFRRYALHYIFNSRISNYSCHIKYRNSLWKAVSNPHNFNHIKQY